MWTKKQFSAQTAKKKKANVPEKATPVFVGRYDVLIGIDPGTHTGFALKESGVLQAVETLTIIEAILRVHSLEAYCLARSLTIMVRIEDARLRTYFGETGPEKWKGAGSIMRDCSIWEDELTRRAIPFQMVHPKTVKETTAKQFEQLCGWTKRTSIHAREAAWMII